MQRMVWPGHRSCKFGSQSQLEGQCLLPQQAWMMSEQGSHPNQAPTFFSLAQIAFEAQVKTHSVVLALAYEFIGSVYKLIWILDEKTYSYWGWFDCGTWQTIWLNLLSSCAYGWMLREESVAVWGWLAEVVRRCELGSSRLISSWVGCTFLRVETLASVLLLPYEF